MGYIYLIQSGDESGPVKIGHARNPWKRRSSLQCGNPSILKIRKLVEYCGPASISEVEAEFHWRFRRYRIRGEWFGSEVLKFWDVAPDGGCCFCHEPNALDRDGYCECSEFFAICRYCQDICMCLVRPEKWNLKDSDRAKRQPFVREPRFTEEHYDGMFNHETYESRLTRDFFFAELAK